MSKINLIVEIEKRTYELLKEKHDNIAESIIANGTPYNPSGDFISREALKEAIKDSGYSHYFEIFDIIDNAQAAEVRTGHDVSDAYDRGFITAMRVYSRPKGEWIKTPDLFRDRICSHCKQQIPYSKLGKFCVECGADMRKGGAEE